MPAGSAPAPAYAGFDCYTPPDPAKRAWLKAHTNLTWMGFYLAPAPSHPRTDWMLMRQTLVDEGWGLAPLYLGQELDGPGSHMVSPARGALDGDDAVALMTRAGFPRGSFVYLDIEVPGPMALPYLTGWARMVRAGGYGVGVYCGHGFAGQARAAVVAAIGGVVRVWAYHIGLIDGDGAMPRFATDAPAGCGDAEAFAWQYDQNRTLLPGLTADLSTALSPDPSAP